MSESRHIGVATTPEILRKTYMHHDRLNGQSPEPETGSSDKMLASHSKYQPELQTHYTNVRFFNLTQHIHKQLGCYTQALNSQSPSYLTIKLPSRRLQNPSSSNYLTLSIQAVEFIIKVCLTRYQVSKLPSPIPKVKILLHTNFGMPMGSSLPPISKFKSINFKSSNIKHMAPKNDMLKPTRSMVVDIKETITPSGIASQASSARMMTRSKAITLSQKEVQHTLATLNTSSLSKQDDETSSDNSLPQISQKDSRSNSSMVEDSTTSPVATVMVIGTLSIEEQIANLTRLVEDLVKRSQEQEYMIAQLTNHLEWNGETDQAPPKIEKIQDEVVG
ncbi:hypothetical protein M9H77_02850 [Catharanthus roseus]|uniref:Uncharacterized protein n=1 Tax=Catharanthus roseus TaxID=4058 RepID=A0ACC0C9K0_CATRO|nr:hypothetical protein M9H77_02850 [Catharanthus roseus]